MDDNYGGQQRIRSAVPLGGSRIEPPHRCHSEKVRSRVLAQARKRLMFRPFVNFGCNREMICLKEAADVLAATSAWIVGSATISSPAFDYTKARTEIEP